MKKKSINYEKIVSEILNGFYNDDYIVIEDEGVKNLFGDLFNSKWIYVPDFIKQCIKVMGDEKSEFSVVSMVNLKEFIKDSPMGVNLNSFAVRFADVYRCKSKNATKRGDKLKATKLSKFWLEVVRDSPLEINPIVFAKLCSLDINLAYDKRFSLSRKRDYKEVIKGLKHKGCERELGMYLIKNGYVRDLNVTLSWLSFGVENEDKELSEELKSAFFHSLFAYISKADVSFDIDLIEKVAFFIKKMKPADAIITYSYILRRVSLCKDSDMVKNAKSDIDDEFRYILGLLRKTRSVEARVKLAKALSCTNVKVFPILFDIGKEIVNVKFHNEKDLLVIHRFIAYCFFDEEYKGYQNRLRGILSMRNVRF